LQWKTRIEVSAADGSVSTLRLFDGAADPVVASPKADGLYARVADGIYPRDFAHRIDILFAPLAAGTDRHIASISGELAGFAVTGGNVVLYVGNRGRLWKFIPSRGQREAIAFRARVTLAVREPTAPAKWTPADPGTSAPLRTIRQPELSPDGSRVVFRATGRLWQQPLRGGQAKRLVDSDQIELDPAFSPDGRQLAFVRVAQGKQEIQILEFQSGKTRTVGPHGECGYEYLTWSPHGELVVTLGGTCNHQVIAIEPRNATRRVLAETSDWEPYPQLSADGQTLYFQAEFPGSKPAFYRLQLTAAAKPESLLPASADGMSILTRAQWVARTVPNRLGIRLSTLDGGRIAKTDVREFSEAGGRDFSLTPDGAALLYVSGNTLWRQPLGGGTREEIPIRLTLPVPTPPSVLLHRVRVLDFAARGFGEETSLLIERGRIKWMGSAQDHELPAGTPAVDAGGRFAIPGLFDVHGHGDGCGGAERIAYGVTSVRNMGGPLAGQNDYADRSDFSGDAAPRCFYAGEMFEGAQGLSGGNMVHLFEEEDARTHVRLWKARGAQFIKLYQQLPWPLQRAAVDEARRVGLPVAAHGITLEQVVKGVTLGYAVLSHWERFYDDALQMFAAIGTGWDPNLAGRSGVEVVMRDEPERFPYATAAAVFRPFGDNALIGAWSEMLRTTQAAYRRGITILPGTDRPSDGLFLQWELEFYAEAGIPPLDILRFATHSSAQMVGAGQDLGTLEVGKLADMVLLDANPLEDIKNTQAIWRVLKGGWVFDPKVLRPTRN
jgi:imidazolonepropionase-like amidohydrolase